MLPVVVSNLFPLLTLPIFTRILTPEDYGVWGLAQVYAVFVNGVANFGLTLGFERNFFENKDTNSRAGLLYSILLFVSIAFIIGGILTFIFKAQLSQWIIGSPTHSFILFWSYCAIGIMGLKSYFLIYFKNTENAKSLTKYTISESILVLIISLFLVAYLRIGIIGLVWGQLIGSFITFSVLSATFIKSVPISFNTKALKNALKLSLPLTPRIFFGIIGKNFDKYLIGLLNSVGGVGIYNIGMKVAAIFFAYIVAIQNVFLPQVYNRMFSDDKRVSNSIGKYLTPFIYISIILGVLISLFSEEIIMVLTPKSYYGAIDVISILSLLYGSYFFGTIPQLLYGKKTFIISILSIIGIGLNILINIPFIISWGVIGAAWGTLTAGLVVGTISFLVSQRYFKIAWEYKKIAAIYSIFFSSSIILVILRQNDVDYWLRLAFKLIAISTYLILGIKINIISKENFLLLKSIVIPTTPNTSQKYD